MTKSIHNTFFKIKVDTIPQGEIVDTSSFQQGQNAYYMKDKVHSNNRGKDLLAHTVAETVIFAITIVEQTGKYVEKTREKS